MLIKGLKMQVINEKTNYVRKIIYYTIHSLGDVM